MGSNNPSLNINTEMNTITTIFAVLISSALADISISRIDRFPLHGGRHAPGHHHQHSRGYRQLPNPLLGLINLIDGAKRRSQKGTTRFIKPSRPSGVNPVWPVKTKSQSASSKLKLHLTPITQRGVLPNFVYLEADQMPGYEKFEKHEIVRDGKTTPSPYLVDYVQSIQDYSSLVDERTSKKENLWAPGCKSVIFLHKNGVK